MKSLDNIMTKLYGPEATQLLGGTNSPSSSNSNVEEVAYPEYISDPDFNLFVKSFYLYKRLVHGKNATIYIIPSHDSLTKMVKNFNTELSKNHIKVNSTDAFKYSMITKLPYKRCIFNVFADSDPDKYHLDKIKNEIKPLKKFGIIKRTNLLSEQYWFQYIDQETILVSPDEDCKSGTKVKLIASCCDSIFVFKGDIVDAKRKYNPTVEELNKAKRNRRIRRPKKSTNDKSKSTTDSTKSKSMKGGDTIESNLSIKDQTNLELNRKMKSDLLNKSLNKGQTGAIKFITNCMTSNDINDILKDVSGDLIHTSFSLTLDDNIKCPDENQCDVTKRQRKQLFNKLIQHYSPLDDEVDSEKMKNEINQTYRMIGGMNLTPSEITTRYIDNVRRLYSNEGLDEVEMKSDIACNLFNVNHFNDINSILSICNSIDRQQSNGLTGGDERDDCDDCDDCNSIYQTSEDKLNQDVIKELSRESKIEFDSNNEPFYTSKLSSIINKSLTAYPLIGMNARTYLPIVNFDQDEIHGDISQDVNQDVDRSSSSTIDSDKTEIDLDKFI